MQCSVYIRIQDGGDRTHDKIIARASSYRKRGVGADLPHGDTENTENCHLTPCPLSPVSQLLAYLLTRHRGPAARSALTHFAFNIQN